MKRKGIVLIVIITFLLSSTFIAISSYNKNTILSIIQEIDTSPCYLHNNISKVVTLEKFSKIRMSSRDSYIINDTEYDDFHPTIAGDINGRFFSCFELSIDGVDYYPDFWYSLDNGMTWDEAGYFSESLGSEFPDVDSNDNGFYGTFSGPEDTPGQLWVIVAEDLTAITGRVWDWSAHGFDDFEYLSISCYTREGELWNWGGGAGTCYNGYYEDIEGAPFIFYGLVISFIPVGVEGYLHSDFAIDEFTEMSYAVWDHTVDANLLVRKDNFGVWDGEYHPHIGSWSIGDGVILLRNASIEAHDDIVVIVCEEEENIVCFYSNNGFMSVQKSTVVDSAKFPEVKVTFDGNTFVCSFVKDDILYRKISENGGATWTDEKQVQTNHAVSEYGSHDLGKGKKNIYAVWEDNIGGDRDIYFGQAYDGRKPDIEIFSITGSPLGIIATIKNNGEAEATNVKWTMTINGGILKKINKITKGTVETLIVGGNIYANSGIIFGLGRIFVTTTVKCDEGLSDKETKSGIQILTFSIL